MKSDNKGLEYQFSWRLFLFYIPLMVQTFLKPGYFQKKWTGSLLFLVSVKTDSSRPWKSMEDDMAFPFQNLSAFSGANSLWVLETAKLAAFFPEVQTERFPLSPKCAVGCLEDHPRTCKWLGSPAFIGHLGHCEAEQPNLRDLLSIDINHLLSGMILKVLLASKS